ncbi:MAG: DUF1801 domain-containing protein [Bauldia sp.]|nr:DUF1801 domain-containing protein [Bauldia sp.]
MAENKTKPHAGSVAGFLAAVDPAAKRDDAEWLDAMMRRVTGEPARMWGDSIVGYGATHYAYASGREGDWFLAGFSPRKANLVLYITTGAETYPALLDKLGKYRTGKSCLYINKLADVDRGVLEELVSRSVAHMKKQQAKR